MSIKPSICDGCKLEFASRNAVFKHLIDSRGACLAPDDCADFFAFVLSHQKRQKVIVLYGYAPGEKITTGNEAALFLLQVLADLHAGSGDSEKIVDSIKDANRSYGNISRSTDIVAQDVGTGAVSEVITCRLPPDFISEAWLDTVNEEIRKRLDGSSAELRVFGKQVVEGVGTKFQAEMDVSHRRVEYLIPVDLFDNGNEPLEELFAKFPSFSDGSFGSGTKHSKDENGVTMNSKPPPKRPTKETLQYLYSLKKIMQSLTTSIVELDENDPAAVLGKQYSEGNSRRRRNETTEVKCKDTTPSVSETVITANERKSELHESTVIADTSRQADGKPDKKLRDRKHGKNTSKKKKESGKYCLVRRHYHNFTPTVMAHEYMAYRRLDRFYHRATLRFETKSTDDGNTTCRIVDQESSVDTDRPFFALSLTGDLFLTGQVYRVVGLFLAIARGVVAPDFVDCVFDEQYPHLVKTPPAPSFAMYAVEAYYTKWEGKLKAILTPRRCHHFSQGWNDEATVSRVLELQTKLRERAAAAWLKDGVDTTGRLMSVNKWFAEVLEPWAVDARKQLEHYRVWKKSVDVASSEIQPSTPSTGNQNNELSLSSDLRLQLEMVDPAVPLAYVKVLHYLRLADSSGNWPATTPNRQVVMVSNLEDEHKSEDAGLNSLSRANAKVKSRVDERLSAYAFVEGQGGASGSFSVGAMPGDNQPRANVTFPELMRAAFELEIALCPDREPSSMIAINRNAQFRPHVDSGAGAGQSTRYVPLLQFERRSFCSYTVLH
jgi:tRNA U38,U39,U40 pseudouridine synthase TruA